MTELPKNCFYPDLLIRMKFNEDAILPKFAVAQWNEAHTHGRLIALAKSSNGIWKINGQDLRRHSLVVPSIEVQKETISRLDAINEREAEVASNIRAVKDVISHITKEIMERAANV